MIWSSSDAQEIDRLSSQVYSVPSLQLMEEAGRATFHLALRLWRPYSHFIILAGGGNNGGDALVVARFLFDAKFAFTCFDLGAGKETPERRHQRLELEKKGFTLNSFDDEQSLKDFAGKDLIVIDGLLGLGLKGPLRDGPLRDCLMAVRALNAKTVLAIDLPSGLSADAWASGEAILPATHCITFGALKPVHVGEPSRRSCGRVTLARLAFAPEAIQTVLAKRSIDLIHADSLPRLPDLWLHLPADAHKYDRGHVLAIGGSPGKVGAILMAAQAALKAGAGWVSVAPLSEIFAPAWPREFTYESFALEGVIDIPALKEFVTQRKVKAILIGPGTMESPLNRKVMEALFDLQKKSALRLIFDAAALTDVLELSKGLTFDPDLTLLTPHPGEWKRIAGKTQNEKNAAPQDLEGLAATLSLLKNSGFSAIYKSASPMIFSPDKARFLTRGDNRLGRAGSGDVLAGLTLGLSNTPYPLHELVGFAQNMMALSASLQENGGSPLEILAGIL